MSALYPLKTLVARHPALAIPLARLRGRGEVVGPATDIVIEGFPRTGSSFAVAAFRRAQDRPVRIAHHVHAPAQVVYAARRGIPALVLIREPEDAILSHVIRAPDISLRQALVGYCRFYGPLVPLRDRFETATFGEVTTDFGAVIRRINRRFGTSFGEFEHTDQNAASVMEEIEADYLTRDAPGERLERIIPRPSRHRERVKAQLREPYRRPSLTRLRARAEGLFERLTSG